MSGHAEETTDDALGDWLLPDLDQNVGNLLTLPEVPDQIQEWGTGQPIDSITALILHEWLMT